MSADRNNNKARAGDAGADLLRKLGRRGRAGMAFIVLVVGHGHKAELP